MGLSVCHSFLSFATCFYPGESNMIFGGYCDVAGGLWFSLQGQKISLNLTFRFLLHHSFFIKGLTEVAKLYCDLVIEWNMLAVPWFFSPSFDKSLNDFFWNALKCCICFFQFLQMFIFFNVIFKLHTFKTQNFFLHFAFYWYFDYSLRFLLISLKFITSVFLKIYNKKFVVKSNTILSTKGLNYWWEDNHTCHSRYQPHRFIHLARWLFINCDT